MFYKMKNIISELFYGNIDPQTRSYQKGSYIQKYITILANAEEVLTKNLSGDDKKTFLSYANASNLDSFIVGFRLGARFIYDTFVSNSAPFIDYLKDEAE